MALPVGDDPLHDLGELRVGRDRERPGDERVDAALRHDRIDRLTQRLGHSVVSGQDPGRGLQPARVVGPGAQLDPPEAPLGQTLAVIGQGRHRCPPGLYRNAIGTSSAQQGPAVRAAGRSRHDGGYFRSFFCPE